MALFYPTLYRRRITDVTVEDMERLGAKGILLDIDNTLTIHDSPCLDEAVSRWIAVMRQAGYPMTVVSNNREERVRPFAQAIGLGYQSDAAKPLPKGYRLAAEKLGLSRKECVAIGDQIFTDIVGANLAGMPCVLLEPIEPEVQQRFIVFKRVWERLLMKCPREQQRRREDYGAS